MKVKILSVQILMLVMTFAFSACQKSIAENKQIENQNISSISPPPTLNPTIVTKSVSSIRKVDFKNFTYNYPQFEDTIFTLQNGEKEKTEEEDGAILEKIEYGDITNDSKEEAMISILPETGGNCQCEMVFIYTLENEKPKLLWSFDTWDRAQGGFIRIDEEKGLLVVETFGENKFENDKWIFSFPKKNAGGYCCPTAFTRIRFKWNGEKFVVEGTPELFDY